jgi:hypothetical protein
VAELSKTSTFISRFLAENFNTDYFLGNEPMMDTKEIINRRIDCISNHLIDEEDCLGNHLVAGELKNFYNQHIKGSTLFLLQTNVLDRAKQLKNKLYTPRNPRSLGTFESLLLWFYIVAVSLPWLSYILIISFTQSSRKKNVSLVNEWATFILTKVS